MARKEVVERDDAIERRLGKQGLEREHAPGADAEVDIATPIELRPERRALRRTGGGARGPAPLGCDRKRGGREQKGGGKRTASTLPPGGRRADTEGRRSCAAPTTARSQRGGGLLRTLVHPATLVEGLLRMLIELARCPPLPGPDGVPDLHVLPLEARDLGHSEERLRQEPRPPPGARHELLVLLGELVHAENGD